MTHTLIIGGGIAGMSAALRLAEAGLPVTVLAKRRLADGASYWSQGGIAAAVGDDDNWQLHASDTVGAGGGLSRPSSVEAITKAAPVAIHWLQEQGVAFTRDGMLLHLTREGGHSRRRVVHADDATGYAVMTVLEARAREHPLVQCLEGQIALEILTTGNGPDAMCCGALVLDTVSGRQRTLFARNVVLATGGAAGVYARNTSPAGATGDGIAMAWRAGCRVANMEYTQFHPTCLARESGDQPLLISEAVRGEGGHLLLPDGTRFMSRHHPKGELACRDIVSRAIFREMTLHDIPCVYLDISHKPSADVRRMFPTLYARCLELGLDMTRGPVPVSPAAHYTCGGVAVDAQGRTDLGGLYAVGECAWTGLHGANRLASNSLLEGLVCGEAAARDIVGGGQTLAVQAMPQPPAFAQATITATQIEPLASKLAALMTQDVGIVRNDAGLTRSLTAIDALGTEVGRLWRSHRPEPALVELRNRVDVCRLIVRSALKNPGSRGAHFNCDHPDAPADAYDTVLVPARTAASQAA